MKRLKSKIKEFLNIRSARALTVCVLILLCVIAIELLISNTHLIFIDKDEYETDFVALDSDIDLNKNKTIKYKFNFSSRDVFALRISSVRDAGFEEPVTVQIKAYSEISLILYLKAINF